MPERPRGVDGYPLFLDAIYNRDGTEKGECRGTYHRCRMEGCNGLRITVRWPEGRITYPCSKGLEPFEGGWRIV